MLIIVIFLIGSIIITGTVMMIPTPNVAVPPHPPLVYLNDITVIGEWK